MQKISSEVRIHVERLDSLPRLELIGQPPGLPSTGLTSISNYPAAVVPLLSNSALTPLYSEKDCVPELCDLPRLIMTRIVTDVQSDDAWPYSNSVVGADWIRSLLQLVPNGTK